MTEQFDRRYATFNPRVTDTLRPEMVEKIGETAVFEAMFLILEGTYAGEFAWLSHDPGWYWWVPESDLAFADE